MTIHPDWEDLLSFNGLSTLDDLFGLTDAVALTKRDLPRWRERLRVALTDRSGRKQLVYVKRFQHVPLAEQFRRCWGRDPSHATAWTEWHELQRLADAGINAPHPIAYGEDMAGWWERRSAVVLGAVGGMSLERWCAEHPHRLPAPVARALAELVARVHALGIAHRDLYLSHIFAEGVESDAPRLSIIDLQRVVPLGRGARRWIVKDLAALNYSTPAHAASARDRLRWLKRYRSLFGLRRQDRVLVRRIVGKTERMRRHDVRRRRKAVLSPEC